MQISILIELEIKIDENQKKKAEIAWDNPLNAVSLM